MKQKLLVCVAFHYNEEYIPYLYEVLEEFVENYSKYVDIDIIVDTNSTKTIKVIIKKFPTVQIVVHSALKHPFYLTWTHRRHIYNRIDKYDVFMYVEGDMKLPYENYQRYIENWELIWPNGVPVLFRIETNNGILYNSDAEKPQEIKLEHVITKNNRIFVTDLDHPLPYHAMWICPSQILKTIMPSDFVRFNKSRENAASFLIWQMKKKGYMEMSGNNVSSTSYVYHLPNNYCKTKGRLGQIPASIAIRIIS